MRTLLFFMTVLVLALSAQGQTGTLTPAGVYDSRLIQHYSSTRFMVSGKILKTRELLALLRTHPASAEEFRKYRRNRTIRDILQFAGCAAIIGSVPTLWQNEDVSLGLLGGGLVLTVAALPPAVLADRGLHKCINLYNRAMLSEAAGEGR